MHQYIDLAIELDLVWYSLLHMVFPETHQTCGEKQAQM